MARYIKKQICPNPPHVWAHLDIIRINNKNPEHQSFYSIENTWIQLTPTLPRL